MNIITTTSNETTIQNVNAQVNMCYNSHRYNHNTQNNQTTINNINNNSNNENNNNNTNNPNHINNNNNYTQTNNNNNNNSDISPPKEIIIYYKNFMSNTYLKDESIIKNIIKKERHINQPKQQT